MLSYFHHFRFLIGCRMLLMMTSWFHVIISGTEYCLNQSFEAKCGPHEVVMVHTTAYYGRMKLGTCVQRDYGSMGCKADVTEVLTGECSGKDSCKIVNLEAFFSRFNRCPADLKSYLDANVTCMPVQRQTCSSDGLIHLSAHWSGQGPNVISGSVPMVMSAGTEFMECPYVLESKPGQRINITLSDFFELTNQDHRIDDSMETKLRLQQHQQQQQQQQQQRHQQQQQQSRDGKMAGADKYNGHEDDENLCKKYATIWDGSEVKNLVMCRRNAEVFGRLESVYVSMSNKVKLKIEAGITQRFILTYNVIGCPFPDLPHDSHIQIPPGRDTRWPTAMPKLTIRCNQSEDSIVFTCKNGIYVSENNQAVINCTRKLPQGLPEDWTSNSEMKSFFPYGISMLLVAVVATCICLITLAIGLLYVNRKDRRLQNARKLTSLMNGGSVPFDMIAIPGAYDHLSTDPDMAKGATYPTSKKGQHYNYPHNRRPECQYSPVANRNWHGAHGTMTPSSPERRLLIPQDTSTIKLPSPIMSTTTSQFRGNLPLPHIPMDGSSDTMIMSDVCSEPSSCMPSTITPPTIRCSCTMPKQMNKNRLDVLPGVIKKLNTERKNRKPSFDAGNQKRSNFFTTSNATKSVNQKPIKHQNRGYVPSSSSSSSSTFFSTNSSTIGSTCPPTFSTFKPVDVVESCVSVQNRSNNINNNNNNDNYPQHFCSQDDPDWSGLSGNKTSFQTPGETTRNNFNPQRQCPTPKATKTVGVRFTLSTNDKQDEHRAYKMAEQGSALV